MNFQDISKKSYFELAEHNTIQVIVFISVFIVSTFFVYEALEFGMVHFFTDFLNGDIHKDGSVISYNLEYKLPEKQTDPYFSWAVDVYKNTPSEARYWFNPLLSLLLPSLLIAISLAVVISALLPQSLGMMRQKIDREIAMALDSIALAKDGFHNEEGLEDIIQEILHADLRDLHEYEKLWKMPLEDLKVLHKTLRWYSGSILYRMFHINDGIRMYMRSYFTVKYGNTVLGFVYIGAAVLIIIIGLRGLKFIPPTQPSLVLFALGLEFSLLLTYAFTLMYSRDSEGDIEQKEDSKPVKATLGDSHKFSNYKEIESLLRVFIKKSKD